MFKFSTRRIVYVAILAALYAVFTLFLAPISYGVVQFRVSEILKIFVLFDPFLAVGIGFGTLIANITSPMVGPWELIWMPFTDMAGGVLAWGLFLLLRKRLPFLPMLVYALTTGMSVGLMLYFFGLGGFWWVSLPVFVSEAVLLIGGLPLLLPAIRALHLFETPI